MVKNKALADSARLCQTLCTAIWSFFLCLSLSLSLPRRLGPIKAGLTCLLSLSPTPFILTVPPGSCRGWIPAHLVYGFLCLWFPLLYGTKDCKFDEVPFVYFCFYFCCLGSLTSNHWYDLCQRMFCLCSLLGVLSCHVLCLYRWCLF